MPTIPCPYCRQATVVALHGVSRCAHCGGAITIGRSATPAPGGSRKWVDRLMLVAVAAWIVAVVATFVWTHYEQVESFSRLAREANTTLETPWSLAIYGSMCLWFFETMFFAAVILALWVVRQNLRG